MITIFRLAALAAFAWFLFIAVGWAVLYASVWLGARLLFGW